MSRIRAPLILLLLMTAAVAADEPPAFSTPASADEVLEAKDLPFRLHYDSDAWELQPQPSRLALLARVTHRDGFVSGAFDYRTEPLTEDAVREREVSELESAFASHEIEGFDRRRVNGHEVLFMRARATTGDGREVVVRGYLWRGDEGTADYGVVVDAGRFDEFGPRMMDLLNGFDMRADGESDA